MKRTTALTLEKNYGEGYMAMIGAKGGKKKVAKGFSKLPPERKTEIQEKALAARKAKHGY